MCALTPDSLRAGVTVDAMITTAAVQFYDVVVFFHIAAVVVGFGPTFAYAAYLTMAQREGGQAIPLVGRTIVFWDRTVNTAAMT